MRYLIAVCLGISSLLVAAPHQKTKKKESRRARSETVVSVVETPQNPYQALRIDPVDKNRIYKLIHSLGTDSWFDLLLKKGEMEKIGQQVDHIHPFRFLGTIVIDGHLKDCLRSIRKSSLKWDRFIKGLSGKLDRNYGDLPRIVPGFADAVGKDKEHIEGLCNRREWTALVDYLLN